VGRPNERSDGIRELPPMPSSTPNHPSQQTHHHHHQSSSASDPRDPSHFENINGKHSHKSNSHLTSNASSSSFPSQQQQQQQEQRPSLPITHSGYTSLNQTESQVNHLDNRTGKVNVPEPPDTITNSNTSYSSVRPNDEKTQPEEVRSPSEVNATNPDVDNNTTLEKNQSVTTTVSEPSNPETAVTATTTATTVTTTPVISSTTNSEMHSNNESESLLQKDNIEHSDFNKSDGIVAPVTDHSNADVVQEKTLKRAHEAEETNEDVKRPRSGSPVQSIGEGVTTADSTV